MIEHTDLDTETLIMFKRKIEKDNDKEKSDLILDATDDLRGYHMACGRYHARLSLLSWVDGLLEQRRRSGSGTPEPEDREPVY